MYERAFNEWLEKREKATGEVKKRIDEQEQPTPGDTYGLYEFEYLNYKLAKKIWLIRKDEASSDKEKTYLENNRPVRPLPPQPDDDINHFVDKYLKVFDMFCAQCSLLPERFYPEAKMAERTPLGHSCVSFW